MIPRPLQPTLSRIITSDAARRARHGVAAIKRRLRSEPRAARVYLRVGDPYSLLLAQVLPALARRFDVAINVHVIEQLDPEMYPDRARLDAWALQDATNVARLYGLTAPGARVPDAPHALRLAELDDLHAIAAHMQGAWAGNAAPTPHDADRAHARIRASERTLHDRGHYLPAMIDYGGEWYWGVDRLDHLERRWLAEGHARRADDRPRYVARHRLLAAAPIAPAANTPLIVYWSARSPYSYLVLERAYRLADAYGVAVQLRPVLPMVMRQLAVPPTKRWYILLDAKREADAAGVALGRVCDPVGAGIERCYALFDSARDAGRDRAFALAFGRAVWSQGIDAATDRGLSRILTTAGLDPALVNRTTETGWRAWAEQHRQELLAAGHWGVPTLRYSDVTVWGQDRMWVLEAAMRGEPIAPIDPGEVAQ